MDSGRLAAASFDEQDAGSGPVTSSPMLGPMTGAIHNISTRNLHDITAAVPDDRQFLKAWRRTLQDCLTRQNARIIQFLLTDICGNLNQTEIVRRCTDVLNKYSKPTWNFASSVRDLALSTSIDNETAAIERELGVSPTILRDQIRKAIRMYSQSAVSLTDAEARLEEKLKRLETAVARVNELMFMEPTEALEEMVEPARAYLDSVFNKISLEEDYHDLVLQHKRFVILKGLVSLSTIQKPAAPSCTICMTKEVNHVVTPCGHTFCDDCCRSQMTACFICRVQIRDKIRLYFS